MNELLHRAALSVPLFTLIALGYALMRWGRWPENVAEVLNRFVFTVALPAFLLHTMSDRSHPPLLDVRLLIAFFGGCFIVFLCGRVIAKYAFKLDGVSGSVFALGGVFSNNGMLGVPLARELLGPTALPSVALIIVFHSLILWTLITVSIEWARHGKPSLQGFRDTVISVIKNPIIQAIFLGATLGLTQTAIPSLIEQPLALLSKAATPLCLITLGMGLAQYGTRSSWGQSLAICTIKLVLQPFIVFLLARLLGLPRIETEAVVLIASIATGVNVYMMACQFKALEGAVATSLVFSTALSAFTTPLALTLCNL